jgi:hypothetical protein
MIPDKVADDAIKGLTAWEQISHLVQSLGGDWKAVAAIAILSMAVVAITLAFFIIAYLTYRSHNRTKIQLARIASRRSKP